MTTPLRRIGGLLRQGMTGRSHGDGLPPRVRTAIEAQQTSGEIVIGWVQLVVVLTFAALYMLSPGTFMADGEFRPIPWVLGAYFTFTLVRLGLAYRGRLPGWFLALSIVSDMVLLLGTIWSFHIQYMQPATFYLKAPTVLYIFIFIALRALRFDPVYVVLAGLAAAGGWLVLVGYALFLDTEGLTVTRDYVRYLTSNAVLIGAEFDKVISILVVTAILAAALIRARRLMVTAVSEGIASAELSRFFAPEVAARITGSQAEIEAGSGDSRTVTILFVDIRGFTNAAADRSPAQVMALLGAYQQLVVPIVRAHGGSIDKFLGDGIMATFGAAQPSETHAADALGAIAGIIDATGDWPPAGLPGDWPGLRVCAAAATGPAIFGAVGDADRLEYTVIGAAVNRAAKLEKHNKEEGARAICDQASFEQGLRQGYAPRGTEERRPGRRIEGEAAPLDIVVLAR